MPEFTRRLKAGLTERFSSTWVLLSETTTFLSRTSIFPQYEGQLRALRARLSSRKEDDRVVREVRKELTELRASLRIQGYDLSLGALDLSVKGFRNDAAVAEGFKRMVLFIGTRDLWFISGQDNHQVLHDFLEAECERRSISSVRQKHYLWFRWSRNQLQLSGADSERAEDFEQLRLWAEVPENRLVILGKLKRAR